jgi:hypothetical protein
MVIQCFFKIVKHNGMPENKFYLYVLRVLLLALFRTDGEDGSSGLL